jgi:hypothetical protein
MVNSPLIFDPKGITANFPQTGIPRRVSSLFLYCRQRATGAPLTRNYSAHALIWQPKSRAAGRSIKIHFPWSFGSETASKRLTDDPRHLTRCRGRRRWQKISWRLSGCATAVGFQDTSANKGAGTDADPALRLDKSQQIEGAKIAGCRRTPKFSGKAVVVGQMNSR